MSGSSDSSEEQTTKDANGEGNANGENLQNPYYGREMPVPAASAYPVASASPAAYAYPSSKSPVSPEAAEAADAADAAAYMSPVSRSEPRAATALLPANAASAASVTRAEALAVPDANANNVKDDSIFSFMSSSNNSNKNTDVPLAAPAPELQPVDARSSIRESLNNPGTQVPIIVNGINGEVVKK